MKTPHTVICVFRSRIGIKSPKIWRRIFEPYSRRALGSISRYVPKGATKKAKKASHMGEFILIMGLILGGLLFSCTAFAGTPETLAVLPFNINADKNLDYLKQGISTMLYSRLTCPEKVVVVPPKKITNLERELKTFSGKRLIHEVAGKTGSRYVVFGTITSLAGTFSIDAKVFDTTKKKYMAFFEQSKNSDDLIKKVDRIAAAINYKVFQRQTVAWEQMEQEKQKALNALKDRNPEHLMQMPAGWQPEEKIGWKVWKYLF